MHLKQFSVKGFKNFRQKIILEEMGAICVIHGENNIGKSNVLEAMQLFFQLLKVQYQHRLVLSTEMTFSEIKQLGFMVLLITNSPSFNLLTVPMSLKLRQMMSKKLMQNQ